MSKPGELHIVFNKEQMKMYEDLKVKGLVVRPLRLFIKSVYYDALDRIMVEAAKKSDK